ncbi:MAG: RNA-binding domain-containing protein [Candidatus Bathyarchaeia archaeon]|nr:RNA-binding domain-containing protein [Candidatus Bathyarchaeia archaeon]
MSSKAPIGYIDIRVFAHATEDADKVLSAVRTILPTELVDKVVFKKTSLTGHYKNPIIFFETRIKEKDAVKAVFEKLASGLSSLDKELLNNQIKQHLDRGNLYIRLDKQDAYLNELKLCSIDPIHFRIHFKKSNPEEIVNVCKKFGMLP